MANVTSLAAGGTAGIAFDKGGVLFHEIDVAAAVAAGLTSGAYVTVLNVPVDSYFRLLQAEIVDAFVLGSGADLLLGDNQDADEFVTTTSTLTAGTNLTLTKQNGTDGDVFLTAGDVRMTLTGASITAGTATGKIRFAYFLESTARIAPMGFVGNIV